VVRLKKNVKNRHKGWYGGPLRLMEKKMGRAEARAVHHSHVDLRKKKERTDM